MSNTDKVLIVGCGTRPKPGAVNLDKFPLPGVDVVFDLDRIGITETVNKVYDLPRLGITDIACPKIVKLPFDNQTFDRIECEDVLEHAERFVEIVNELGRVLKIGGTLWARGPHWNYPEALWNDPTHKRAFTPRTFAGWDPRTYDGQHYGHYLSQNGIHLRIVSCVEKNRGLEVTMIRIKGD